MYRYKYHTISYILGVAKNGGGQYVHENDACFDMQ